MTIKQKFLGEKLQELGITHDELALAMNVNVKTVYSILKNGEIKKPDYLKAIVTFLKVSPFELLDDEWGGLFNSSASTVQNGNGNIQGYKTSGTNTINAPEDHAREVHELQKELLFERQRFIEYIIKCKSNE